MSFFTKTEGRKSKEIHYKYRRVCNSLISVPDKTPLNLKQLNTRNAWEIFFEEDHI